MTDPNSQHGGVDRRHAASIRAKLVFAVLHGAIVGMCVWLAFGGVEWADPWRAKVLAFCAVLYFLRHLITLFVLLQRKVALSEVWGLVAFMAVFEVGFLYLGAGGVSHVATPFRAFDWVGIGLIALGSFLNTGSELQRHVWKKHPSAKGRCYTGGLFAHAMHINYFGDSVLFTGWAILAVSLFAFLIPLVMTVLFIAFHIPALDAYLARRYGAEFDAYARKTAKFVPYLY